MGVAFPASSLQKATACGKSSTLPATLSTTNKKSLTYTRKLVAGFHPQNEKEATEMLTLVPKSGYKLSGTRLVIGEASHRCPQSGAASSVRMNFHFELIMSKNRRTDADPEEALLPVSTKLDADPEEALLPVSTKPDADPEEALLPVSTRLDADPEEALLPVSKRPDADPEEALLP